MRKNNHISILFSTILIILSLLGAAANGTAQVREEALDSILPKYSAWGTAELSAKLHAGGLPVTPTLKIYMKKGTDIDISVRAPFVGEVGRITLSGDSLLAVNKMKKVYALESISGIKYDYPDFTDYIQSFLLGRVVVLNAGELAARNADFMDFTEISSDSISADVKIWSLTFPKGRTDADEFGYEYRVNSKGHIESLLLDIAQHDLSLKMDYTYPGDRREMNITLNKDFEKKFEVSLEFDQVKWGAKAPAPLNLNDKYRQVDIKQFLKSF